MSNVYEKYDNDWEFVAHEKSSLTERIPVIGGWIVRDHIFDEQNGVVIATSMVFISDSNHDWDIPCNNSLI